MREIQQNSFLPLENEVVGVPSPELGSVQSKRSDGRENSAPRNMVTAKEMTPRLTESGKEVTGNYFSFQSEFDFLAHRTNESADRIECLS